MTTELNLISVSPRSAECFRKEVKTTPGWRIVERLEPERFLCESPGQDCRLLFALHRFPVQSNQALSDFEDPSTVCAAVLESLPLTRLSQSRFSIQISANRRMPWKFGELVDRLVGAAELDRSAMDVRHPQRILSLYFHQSDDRNLMLGGLSTPSENLSAWSCGHCRIPRDPEAVSRAEAKLLEALECFPVIVGGQFQALDLGAAPGGWSRILAGRGYSVDAVDPAPLDPRVASLSNVTHSATTAGDFLKNSTKLYDLIVCDMKMEASKLVEFLAGISGRLQPKGQLLGTLKLKRGREWALHEARKALAELGKGYQVRGARQLYFNRSEVTFLAERW